MSTQAAGGLMMWFGGLVFGMGAGLGVWSLMASGTILSILGAIYIRKFAEID
jgi:hypothetical protein